MLAQLYLSLWKRGLHEKRVISNLSNRSLTHL